MRGSRFEIRPWGAGDGYEWVLIAGNGKELVESDYAYDTVGEAKRAAEAVNRAIRGSAPITVKP